jgi:RNA polymerase sigma-70 factor (ECF subfamily)
VDRGDEVALASAIRKGDEQAFIDLVARHHGAFTRLARVWVGSASIAEEVVQETWAIALEKLAEFAGRSSLKTWLCGILLNTARARARKERRAIAFSDMDFGAEDPAEPAVPRDRFSPPGHRWEGHWQAAVRAWPETPEAAVLSGETLRILETCLNKLPEPQRAVLILRDVEGLTGEEICNALGVSDTHQRVLLHRARSRMRILLERTYDDKKAGAS